MTTHRAAQLLDLAEHLLAAAERKGAESADRRSIRTASAADALPVGSIIADITEPDAPATACKAARGDWQFLGDDPDRRYWSSEVFPPEDAETDLKIVLLYEPATGGAS
jgi:hypothetical protein